MKARIKNHLSITKKEWNGMVVLIVLIILVLATPYLYQLFYKDNTINFKDFDAAAAQLEKAGDGYGFNHESENSGRPADSGPQTMFVFNPNHLPVAQWKKLGLSVQQINVIKHYEEKGGRFYKKEDLKKIYPITAEDYQRLEPYIDIPESSFPAKPVLRAGEKVELNTADSAKLTALKGIGPSLAVIIIRYRGRLGGFVHKEQLKEVYGIDDVKYADLKDQISVNSGKIKKIDINSISFNQLRLFPYLKYKQANAIIEYRNQHGNYHSMDDLRNIMLLDDEILRKIEPYLSFK
ncbi:MAG TPA: helix-hairpin-helix domain-containing protein [Mucilaginibacter sp.]|nr:helix-hairpin-helix domain-containing protein [Mucilaginibacter sp.]